MARCEECNRKVEQPSRHLVNGRRVQNARAACRIRAQCTPELYGPRPALLERRIVEKRKWIRVENLV